MNLLRTLVLLAIVLTLAGATAVPSSAPAPAPTPTPTPTPLTTHPSTTVAPRPQPIPSETGELDKAILAGGWIPFVVVMVVALLFSFSYVRYYQHKSQRECGSTTVAILALAVALLTGALVPVDIYLVSTLKDHHGAYKPWASLGARDSMKDIVTYAYYAMYALTELFVFVLLPLAYFFYEEKDEEQRPSCARRLCNALKFTLGFVVVFGVLLCVGAFAIGSGGAQCLNSNSTSTKDWIQCRAQYAEHALTSNGGANAISFSTGALTLIGFLYVIFYTAYGMVAMPIEMIRSRGKAAKAEISTAKENLRVNRSKQDEIKEKYSDRRKAMPARERDALNRHKEAERVVERAASRLEAMETSCWGKAAAVLRPFEFVLGIILFFFGIFLVVSLLMTTLDKLLQIEGQHLNFKTGYSHVTSKLVNPVDKMFTVMQKVFPLDYIFLTFLVYYFILCTMSGIRALDVRMCWMRMFKIRPQGTVPQGLLFMCMILMFSILTLNVLLLTLMPTYVSFGNQRFSNLPLPANNASCAVWKAPLDGLSVCTYQAPAFQYFVHTRANASSAAVTTLQVNVRGVDQLYDAAINNCKPGAVFHFCDNTTLVAGPLLNCSRVEEPCTQTRMAALLNAFFYNLWVFGAAYFWANFGIVGVFAFALVWLTCRRRKSLMQTLVSDAKEDFDDSDDDMVPFNPSWKK